MYSMSLVGGIFLVRDDNQVVCDQQKSRKPRNP